ncbi:MAG: LysE family transporter [Muribaculaceae bacterium]|nr:LysE family transporter [Muribaculaceae bacterium]
METLIYTILKGMAIGLLISAPMGPIGVLCIRRTLNSGRWSGFFTGLGASFSDIIYCLLTGLGLSFIIDFVTANQNILQILGSVVLLIFAYYLIKHIPKKEIHRPRSSRKKISCTQDFITGFFFTLSNPLIIFLIIGLFARFNFLDTELNLYYSIIGFISIMLGAIMWWFVITLFVDAVRNRFNTRTMVIINRTIGIIILIMALVGLVMGTKAYFFA